MNDVLDACVVGPCKNGGHCSHNGTEEYMCVCARSYTHACRRTLVLLNSICIMPDTNVTRYELQRGFGGRYNNGMNIVIKQIKIESIAITRLTATFASLLD